MDDRQRFRKTLLFILLGFIVLLYCLGAASVWIRQRFSDGGGAGMPTTTNEFTAYPLEHVGNVLATPDLFRTGLRA